MGWRFAFLSLIAVQSVFAGVKVHCKNGAESVLFLEQRDEYLLQIREAISAKSWVRTLLGEPVPLNPAPAAIGRDGKPIPPPLVEVRLKKGSPIPYAFSKMNPFLLFVPFDRPSEKIKVKDFETGKTTELDNPMVFVKTAVTEKEELELPGSRLARTKLVHFDFAAYPTSSTSTMVRGESDYPWSQCQYR